MSIIFSAVGCRFERFFAETLIKPVPAKGRRPFWGSVETWEKDGRIFSDGGRRVLPLLLLWQVFTQPFGPDNFAVLN